MQMSDFADWKASFKAQHIQYDLCHNFMCILPFFLTALRITALRHLFN